jgi:ATP-dependent RNA helicase DHX29
MAPNKKKKKAAANPARGFATTSLPSRSKAADVDETNENGSDIKPLTTEDVSTKDNAKHSDVNLAEGSKGAVTGGPKEINEMSPEELEDHLENAELEDLVEQHAARCISEANRQASRLETEQRQLRSLSYRLSTYSWLPNEIVAELYDMDGTDSRHTPPSATAGSSFDKQEKLLLDLWTLKRTLEALLLPAVDDALSHVAKLAVYGQLAVNTDLLPGLLEALQWYGPSDFGSQLPDYDHGTGPKVMQSGDSTPLPATSGKW